MTVQRKPIADVLPGIVVHELPEDAVPLEALVLVKVLLDGRVSWASRATDGLEDADAIGALVGETDRRRADYLDCWEGDDDDD